MESEAAKLRAAIIKHRSQGADDRCQLDDRELYEALGDGIEADFTMPPREEFLANCGRFYDKRCTAGDWPTYQQLREVLAKARDYIAAHLQAEEDTQRVCAKLEGLADYAKSTSDETADDHVRKAVEATRKRIAKTRILLEKIEGLLK